MASSHSVSHWIGQLRAGDQVAAQHLWEGFTTEEVAAKLRGAPRTVERKLDLIRQRFTAERIPPRTGDRGPWAYSFARTSRPCP